MSDKKVPSMGIKKRMSFDGHTLHTMNIHNPYGSTNCIRFEGIISAFPSIREGTPLLLRNKCKGKD